MGVNYFTFKGKSSLDFGLYVGGQGTFNAPQRDVSKITIPGRNGDLIKDNGRWLNIQVPYNIVIMSDFKKHAEEVRAWLASSVKYERLEDTYDIDHFRLARFINAIDFDTAAYNNAGKAVIVFDCKPQRFLKNNQELKQITSGTKIENPTQFESKPLIETQGNGTLNVGGYSLTVAGAGNNYVYIDCEEQNCYNADKKSMNDKVSLSDNKFPLLPEGQTTVSWSGFTKVRIAERWFTI